MYLRVLKTKNNQRNVFQSCKFLISFPSWNKNENLLICRSISSFVMKNNGTKLTCVGVWGSFKNKRVTSCWDGECSELYSFTLISPGSASVRCHKHPPPSSPHPYFLFCIYQPVAEIYFEFPLFKFCKQNTRLLSKLCCNYYSIYNFTKPCYVIRKVVLFKSSTLKKDGSTFSKYYPSPTPTSPITSP